MPDLDAIKAAAEAATQQPAPYPTASEYARNRIAAIDRQIKSLQKERESLLQRCNDA